MKSLTLRTITQIGIGTLIAGAGLAHFTHAKFFIRLPMLLMRIEASSTQRLPSLLAWELPL